MALDGVLLNCILLELKEEITGEGLIKYSSPRKMKFILESDLKTKPQDTDFRKL